MCICARAVCWLEPNDASHNGPSHAGVATCLFSSAEHLPLAHGQTGLLRLAGTLEHMLTCKWQAGGKGGQYKVLSQKVVQLSCIGLAILPTPGGCHRMLEQRLFYYPLCNNTRRLTQCQRHGSIEQNGEHSRQLLHISGCSTPHIHMHMGIKPAITPPDSADCVNVSMWYLSKGMQLLPAAYKHLSWTC